MTACGFDRTKSLPGRAKAMPTPKKNETIAELTELFKTSSGVFLADFSGLNAELVTDLRKRCYDAQVGFRVVKNSLAVKAVEAAELSDLTEHFAGSTALAFCDDPSMPVKVLEKFVKDNKAADGKPAVRTGVVDGQVLSEDQLDFIAKLDSPEVVKAKFLGLLQAPAGKFVGLLSAVPSSMVRVMDQRRQKLDGESGGSEEAAG